VSYLTQSRRRILPRLRLGRVEEGETHVAVKVCSTDISVNVHAWNRGLEIATVAFESRWYVGLTLIATADILRFTTRRSVDAFTRTLGRWLASASLTVGLVLLLGIFVDFHSATAFFDSHNHRSRSYGHRVLVADRGRPAGSRRRSRLELALKGAVHEVRRTGDPEISDSGLRLNTDSSRWILPPSIARAGTRSPTGIGRVGTATRVAFICVGPAGVQPLDRIAHTGSPMGQ
jgi:hypothetical protein